MTYQITKDAITHILSFVPTPQQAALTASTSKTWLAATKCQNSPPQQAFDKVKNIQNAMNSTPEVCNYQSDLSIQVHSTTVHCVNETHVLWFYGVIRRAKNEYFLSLYDIQNKKNVKTLDTSEFAFCVGETIFKGKPALIFLATTRASYVRIIDKTSLEVIKEINFSEAIKKLPPKPNHLFHFKPRFRDTLSFDTESGFVITWDPTTDTFESSQCVSDEYLQGYSIAPTYKANKDFYLFAHKPMLPMQMLYFNMETQEKRLIQELPNDYRMYASLLSSSTKFFAMVREKTNIDIYEKGNRVKEHNLLENVKPSGSMEIDKIEFLEEDKLSVICYIWNNNQKEYRHIILDVTNGIVKRNEVLAVRKQDCVDCKDGISCPVARFIWIEHNKDFLTVFDLMGGKEHHIHHLPTHRKITFTYENPKNSIERIYSIELLYTKAVTQIAVMTGRLAIGNYIDENIKLLIYKLKQVQPVPQATVTPTPVQAIAAPIVTPVAKPSQPVVKPLQPVAKPSKPLSKRNIVCVRFRKLYVNILNILKRIFCCKR